MKTPTTSRGILLAGGSGSRLFPMTSAVSKQLLPVYDKPLIYYPLTTLMLAGIREILVITKPEDAPQFESLMGDGGQWGLSLTYAIQAQPNGIAEALLIGEEFARREPVALILGDNIFHGHGFENELTEAASFTTGAAVFAYAVQQPERYAVIEFDEADNVVSLVEKPTQPRSHYAVPGLYFYDGEAASIAKSLRPSSRGELEINDVNRAYLNRGELRVRRLGRGFAWLDAGTAATLLQAAGYVQTIEERQGIKFACPEEIALTQGFIDQDQFSRLARRANGDYGEYLMRLLDQREEVGRESSR